MTHRLPAMLLLSFALTLPLSGCGGGDSSTPTVSTPVKIPATPDGTIKAVAAELQNNNPRGLWDAMPAKWQQDVDGLVDAFADKMDADVYDKSFAVTSKAADVLKSKKSLILEAIQEDKDDLPIDADAFAQQYDTMVRMIGTIARSDISSRERLKAMSIGNFLGTTGKSVMTDMESLAALAPAEAGNGFADFKDSLTKLEIVVVEATEAEATLSMTLDGKTEEAKMVKIDDKWVPADLAEQWDTSIADARANIDAMTGDDFAQVKPQMMSALNTIDAGLTTMSRAETTEELRQAAMGMVGSVMQQMQSGPGMGPRPDSRSNSMPPSF